LKGAKAMTGFNRRVAVGLAALAALIAGPAAAQEDLDSGKTPAQLYAANCAICHKTPRGLSKAGGPFGLQGFLREHYTASRRAAAAIAAYVDTVDRGAPPVVPKRTAKPKEAGKPGDAKASKAKVDSKSEPAETKPADSKPTDAKPSDTKPSDAAPAEPKPAEVKPASTPSAESKPDSEKKPN